MKNNKGLYSSITLIQLKILNSKYEEFERKSNFYHNV